MIQSDTVNPCDVNILTNIDKPKDKQENQTFYCHANCFESKMHDNVQGYLIVNIPDDEDE
jgi:hypothetical protein